MNRHKSGTTGSDRTPRLARDILMLSVSAAAVVAATASASAQAAPQSQDSPQIPQPVQSAVPNPSTAPSDPATAPDVSGSNQPATTAATGTDDVIVTGLRGSLQRNLNIKRDAPGVVDAISAEDIGKFPDSNVAAALQRVPGVSVSRGVSSIGGLPATTGDATAITVRGFGPQFNVTLFDGRRVSTATGSRSFDFSAVGADFVGEVDILKTPDATLSSGAIGATVNVQYPKPFDHPGLRLAASGSGSINDDEGRLEPTGGILFSDTFAGDTSGVLADFQYTRHKTQTNHINNQGWNGTLFAPCQLAGFSGTCAPTDTATAPVSQRNAITGFVSQDYGIYQEHTTDTRYDGRLAVQWKPTSDVLVTVDDNYSREKVHAEQNGFSVWFNGGSLRNLTLDDNGTTTSFIQPSTPTDFQGQINQQILENNQVGANVKWDATQNLKFELDGSHSLSRLNPGGEISSIDADVGYGGANSTNLGFETNGSNGLPTVTSYGPAGNEAAFINNGVIGSHVLPISSARNKDTVDQIKILGSWSQENLKIRFGGQYVSDRFHLRNYSDFVNNQWQAYSGYGPASGSQTGVALPQDFFAGSFSTKNFIPGFKTGSGLPPQVLAFDPYRVLNYLQGLGNPFPTNTSTCALTPPVYPANPKIPGYNYCGGVADFAGTYNVLLDPASYQDITEQTISGFISANVDTEIASMPFHINVGVREESTTTHSAGLGRLPTGLTVQAGDPTAEIVSFTEVTPVSTRNHYQYLLPNIDLNLDVTDRLKVRFDASRSLTRPQLNLLTPVLNLPTTERVGSLVANGGNPTLSPYLSDNLDLGVEWYYQANSYFSVDTFLKQVSNFIVGGSQRQTINGVVDPTTGQPGQFTVTQQVNGPSAVVRGVEVALQHVFGGTGFGLQANGTFVGTNKPYDPNALLVSGFAVTGLANSANFVGFYDKRGFQARVAVNWRDEYLDHFGQQQNNSRFGTEPTFVNASTQVDFSTSYDVTKQVNVFFEATNLNNETYSTHGRYSNQILDVFKYGRRFTAGVHFRL